MRNLSTLLAILLVLLMSGATAQESDIPLTETYHSAYHHITFNYPAGWIVEDNTGGVSLFNNGDEPEQSGTVRIQFVSSGRLSELGFPINTDAPVEFLDSLRMVFNSDDNTQSEATAITLGEDNRSAARAEGIYRGTPTLYLAVSDHMLFITGETFEDDIADFEPFFLHIAATARYTPPEFADSLPVITPDNAAQFARYMQFDTSDYNVAQVSDVAFSPDGTLAAASLGIRGVQVWDISTGQLLHSLQDFTNNQAVFSPDNSLLYAADSKTGLQVINLSDGQVSTIEVDDGLKTVSVSPDGALLATSSTNGAVHLWNTDTPEITHTFDPSTDKWTKSLAISPDGQWLATSAPVVTLWALSGDSTPIELSDSTGITDMSFSADGTRLATLDKNSTYTVFDVESGDILLSEQPGESVFEGDIALNSDGTLLAVTTPGDGEIALIEVATGTVLNIQNQGGDEVSGLAFSTDGTQLLAGGVYRYTLVIWAIGN